MKLSIIMPLFNVADTLERAIASILGQVVNFDYEIILINDASTDNTSDLISYFADRNENITLIDHAENKGNACSFYDGLSKACGQYFCVLDGDDYYTVPDKLQRQVDFLEADEKREYVATCHHFLYDFGGDRVCVPDRLAITEGTFPTWLRGSFGYYHTSTYMFRNIFHGDPPAFLSELINRGDTPRTYWHLLYSTGKIKVLDFVGSAYVFEYGGIWSSMTSHQQMEYQVKYDEYQVKIASSSFARCVAKEKLAWHKKLALKTESSNDHAKMNVLSISDCLLNVREYAKHFAFDAGDYTFQGIYSSLYIDSLCASLGEVYRVHHHECLQSSVDSNSVAIINGVISPHGGGIYKELLELSELLEDKHVFLFVTDMQGHDSDALSELSVPKNVTLVYPPHGCTDKLGFFGKKMAEFAPSTTYFYASHTDVYAVALSKRGVSKNCLIFSFDHGYVCGLKNPNIEIAIAKRPVDYWMLKRCLATNVIYIPAWAKTTNKEPYDYVPFNGHSKLVTASGAARFYKVDGNEPFNYITMVADLLKETHGRHYHFGPIPLDKKSEIISELSSRGLAEDSFVNIEWAGNIPQALCDNGVDVFIEPFPVVSYKMTLDVLSCGVPVITFHGRKRLEITDFIYPESLAWSDRKDFLDTLRYITAGDLRRHSVLSLQYFNTHHLEKVVSEALRNCCGLAEPKKIDATDANIGDILDYLILFSSDKRSEISISIMSGFGGGDDANASQDKIVKQNEVNTKDCVLIEQEKKETKECNSYKIRRAAMWPIRMIKRLVRKFV